MLRINYSPDGDAISDVMCEEYIKSQYNCLTSDGVDVFVDISTENVIYAARTLVAEGVFNKDKIEFYFNEKFVGKTDKNGRLNNTPDGFGDTLDNFLTRLLDLRICGKLK